MEPTPAYANYLLPQSATSVIPQQLGNDYLSNLEQQLNLSENQQMQQQLAQANQLGTLSSGNTNFNLAQIAGNTQNQFAGAYTGLSNQSTGQAQQQQFGTQFEQQGFQNQLQSMQQQYSYQRALMDLQAQLSPGYSAPSFGQIFGQSLASGIPGLALNAGLGAAQGGIGYFGQQPPSDQFGTLTGPQAGFNQNWFMQSPQYANSVYGEY